MSFNLSSIQKKLKTLLLAESWFDISLYLLFVSFFLAPFVDSVTVRLLTSLLYSLVMIVGVFTMSRHPAIRVTAGLLACIAISLRWLKHILPTPTIIKMGNLAILIFLILLTVVMLAKVFGKGLVTIHRVKGAIAVYLLFGLAWSILYGLLDQTLLHAFNLPPDNGIFSTERQEALSYFSFVTLTTLGYGDITPTHEVTRMFVVLEGLFGQLYPATLLARMVSLELMHRDMSKE